MTRYAARFSDMSIARHETHLPLTRAWQIKWQRDPRVADRYWEGRRDVTWAGFASSEDTAQSAMTGAARLIERPGPHNDNKPGKVLAREIRPVQWRE